MNRKNYLVRYPGIKYILWMIDSFLSLRKPLFRGVILPPKRILLSNLAHLGDIVNATAVLPVLKQAFPGVKIGFVVGSSSKDLIENHPMIDHIHVVDHWKFNRSNISFFAKIKQYYRSKNMALKEIQKQRYDVAMDLYFYLGNAIPLLKKANIPVRIGFTSGGFGPLLTHPVDWKFEKGQVIEYYNELLSLLPISQSNLLALRPTLSFKDEVLYHRLRKRFNLEKKYIVFHPGAGAQFKEWPLSNWRKLLEECVAKGYAVVITGQGKREKEIAVKLVQDVPNVITCVSLLTLKEFVVLLQKADLLVGVDSAAGHIASAVGTQSLLIYPGINRINEWAPITGAHVLQKPVLCAPCFKRKGCKSMECVQGVLVEDVLLQIVQRVIK
ncbi:MAG: glycosyltransferase family 9 protein [Chlamydiales bacterium]|nr:glycosyltransferase family 9 protein [Chlamydiales bacterium]